MFDINYLQQLIELGVEEDPELEYKSAAALQRDDKKILELTKDVSAFANSNGGLIVYGIAENPANKHLPGRIDTVSRKIISKEWLEQILNSKIRPRIHDLKIHVITVKDDEVAYVLEIPKGDTAHQAEDKRYYRRHNFMVESLFDHEIRDIMGRQKEPDIAIEFEITRKANYQRGTNGESVLNDKEPFFYWLNIYANNIGRIYANYINMVIMIPQRCMKENVYNRDNQSTDMVKANNKVRDLVEPDSDRYYKGPIARPPQYGPARHEPLLPGMRVQLKSIPLNAYSTDAINSMTWTVYADNAVPKIGETEFTAIEIV